MAVCVNRATPTHNPHIGMILIRQGVDPAGPQALRTAWRRILSASWARAPFRARGRAAADRAEGLSRRHLHGFQPFLAETTRTQRAANVCALVWVRLWRGVERAPSNEQCDAYA